jgi:hypothetical protein
MDGFLIGPLQVCETNKNGSAVGEYINNNNNSIY